MAKRRKKRPIPSPTVSKSSRWRKLLSRKHILIASASALVTLFGTLTAWISIRPVINLEAMPIAGSSDEFSPRFVVSNSGFLTAQRVGFECMDGGVYRYVPGTSWVDVPWEPTAEDKRQYGQQQDLQRGEKTTYSCIMKPPPPGFTRTEGSFIIVIIAYREPPFWFDTTYTLQYVSHRDAAGNIYWAPEGRGIKVFEYSRSGEPSNSVEWYDPTQNFIDRREFSVGR